VVHGPNNDADRDPWPGRHPCRRPSSQDGPGAVHRAERTSHQPFLQYARPSRTHVREGRAFLSVTPSVLPVPDALAGTDAARRARHRETFRLTRLWCGLWWGLGCGLWHHVGHHVGQEYECDEMPLITRRVVPSRTCDLSLRFTPSGIRGDTLSTCGHAQRRGQHKCA
jgi:hypothetical protein